MGSQWNFESNLFQRVTEVLGIRKTRTTTLHPVRWNDRAVRSYHGRIFFEGGGRRSERSKKVIDYVDDLKEKLLSVHETVRHKIWVASDRMKTRYDLKGNSVGFHVGDLVWLYKLRKRKGRCPKPMSILITDCRLEFL